MPGEGVYIIVGLLLVLVVEGIFFRSPGGGLSDQGVSVMGLTVVAFLAVIAGVYVTIDTASEAVYAVLGAIVGHLATRLKS